MQPNIALSSRYHSIFSFGDSLADTGNFLFSSARKFPSMGRLPYEIGGNDYNYAFIQAASLKQVRSFVPQVVGAIASAISV
ncbi:hypothetical protein ACLOJK_009381 [Asimina triloba]